MKKHLISFLCFVMICPVVFAQSGFDAGSAVASALTRQLKRQINQDILKTAPLYQDKTPKEAAYFNQDVTTLGNKALAKEGLGQACRQVEETVLAQDVSRKDDFVQQSHAVEENAEESMKGETFFCQNGECSHPTYEQGKDFNQAVSALSAAENAGSELHQTEHCKNVKICPKADHWWDHHHCHWERQCAAPTYTLFEGNSMKCRHYWAMADNCCEDTGWAKKIGLAGCDEKEKSLLEAREKKYCHQVGKEYCTHKVVGFCETHQQSYCCYSSALGRIIQEAGHQQLGLGWGDEEHPNCEGLTPEQFQQIDLSQVDFSDYYDLLNKNVVTPDDDKTRQAIIDRAKSEKNRHGVV